MISNSEVMRIAKLAKLKLSADELGQYQNDLNRFLRSGAKLQTMNIPEVERTSHAVECGHRLRADESRPSLSQKTVLANGPHIVDGYFRVPRILEGDE